MNKIIISLILIFSGLLSGYIFQKLCNSSIIKIKTPIKTIRRKMQTFTLTVLIPLTVTAGIWIAPLKHVEIISLPLLGVFALMFGGAAAYMLAFPLRLTREQRGVYAVAGGFTNLGALGGLISFFLIGEKAFALVAFYQLFEKFVYFLAGFPLAKSHSKYDQKGKSAVSIVIESVKDPVITMNTSALVLGSFLNLSGIHRPEVFYSLNQVLIPLSSFILISSIGLAMRFGPMKNYFLPGIVMVVIKSLFVPAVTFIPAYFIGLGGIENGLVLKLLIILSSMPVGFMAMVPPTIYDMDLDIANTCWFFSTASLIAVVPLLSVILKFI